MKYESHFKKKYFSDIEILLLLKYFHTSMYNSDSFLSMDKTANFYLSYIDVSILEEEKLLCSMVIIYKVQTDSQYSGREHLQISLNQN